jgi:hypothetical protein
VSELRKIAIAHGNVEAIALLTPEGMTYCGSEPRGVGVSLSERQYFANSLRAQGIVWGDLQVSKVTGRTIIASSRAIRHEGKVSFVVVVILDLAALKRQTFQQFQLHVARAAWWMVRGGRSTLRSSTRTQSPSTIRRWIARDRSGQESSRPTGMMPTRPSSAS